MQRNSAIPKNHDIRKKVRGSKRKLHSFERRLDSVLLGIPNESLPHDKSWRYHLPSPHKLIDSTDSSTKLRKRFLQLLADKLIALDSMVKGTYKTFLSISLPFLSQSRIEICVDSKYFEKLVNKTDALATWTPAHADKNIIKELNLAVPAGYRARGYVRKSSDTNSKLIEENWIIWKA
jgi:Protein of unknown function (DUF3916)